MQYIERHPMDRATQLTILLSGLGGIILAIITSRPKHVIDGVIAVFASVFGALVVAPALAEVVTNISKSFTYAEFLNASPGTALFNLFVGLGGLLGFQIVITLKADFVDGVKRLLVRYADRKMRDDDRHIRNKRK